MPVAIVGTFAVMAAMGFSLNNLSLFGLVLAIGIVVDDAIVVVENVERWLAQGLPPSEAAIKAMEEVTGPVIAVALVLCAVFVPCAFITRHHRPVLPPVRPDDRRVDGYFGLQLADLESGAGGRAAADSRTAGADRDVPALCLIDTLLGWFFRLFNWGFDRSTASITRTVGLLLRGCILVLVLYGGLLGLTWWGFSRVPVGLHSRTRQGLSAGERAVARRRRPWSAPRPSIARLDG